MWWPAIKTLFGLLMLSKKAGQPWDGLSGWDRAVVLLFALSLLSGSFELVAFLSRRIGQDKMKN
ncbi:hypothetical protein ACFP9V_04810 [Deinococcus radiopugnans]|uniref:Uncharacterized protein n=1 Tax=Deinococcus radiopugnans ATCC 19172 TaxID=585398 RepID=A0A5C4Y9P2_9DEIO|nr:hypothetical protein [Deinococcus radiopugnans]MBB6015723.1 hypothetical protein [Deinococcus radiopugnans ATCC 19172]TNM72590.1 hypothetical protein FHR04_01790 [Deinococcus radiopugnans ATCC 19172]